MKNTLQFNTRHNFISASIVKKIHNRRVKAQNREYGKYNIHTNMHTYYTQLICPSLPVTILILSIEYS